MDQTPAARFIDVLGRLGYKTQQQIADLLQIARPTAGTIVRQEREPSFADVGRLKAEHDEVNVDWIFTGKGDALPKHKTAPPTETAPVVAGVSSQVPTDYGTTVELAITRARVADRDETILEQAREIARLNRELGKPFNGLDAAGSFDQPFPKLPTIGFRFYVSHRVKNQGAARPL